MQQRDAAGGGEIRDGRGVAVGAEQGVGGPRRSSMSLDQQQQRRNIQQGQEVFSSRSGIARREEYDSYDNGV